MTTQLEGNILITGGTGTLGHALVSRITREGWPCRITVYSRDPMRQAAMRREYPRVRFVLGDVCDARQVEAAVAGHDLVLHCAAQKHIPEAETNPAQCYAVNVQGSMNVLDAAIRTGAAQVLAISTDKACWPINAYGLSKLMMERLYQQAAQTAPLRVNLVRYGNVLGSTGSVLEVWARQLAMEKPCRVTDPAMTRFWLSSAQAVDLILFALSEPSGTVTIPRLPALSMAKLMEYRVPEMYRDANPLGLRPGEKLHEMLLTPQEAPFMARCELARPKDAGAAQYMRLYPVTGTPVYFRDESVPHPGYTSDRAPELTREALADMIAGRDPVRVAVAAQAARAVTA